MCLLHRFASFDGDRRAHCKFGGTTALVDEVREHLAQDSRRKLADTRCDWTRALLHDRGSNPSDFAGAVFRTVCLVSGTSCC